MGYSGSRLLKGVLKEATEEAIHAGAAWLADEMQQLVNIQCGAASSHEMSVSERAKHDRERSAAFGAKHAPEGQPPYRETGQGQASIKWQKIPGGAAVGVEDIGTQNMIGGNYMAGWDSPGGIRGHHHPWLSTWRQYQKQLAFIILDAMKTKLGET